MSFMYHFQCDQFDCLLYEVFFIEELKPSLNTQEDSNRAKLFT